MWSGEQCRTLIDNLPETLSYCVAFHNATVAKSSVQLLAFEQGDKLIGVWAGTPLVAIPAAELEAELFAQYYGDKPILRRTVTNAEIPVSCRHALLVHQSSRENIIANDYLVSLFIKVTTLCGVVSSAAH